MLSSLSGRQPKSSYDTVIEGLGVIESDGLPHKGCSMIGHAVAWGSVKVDAEYPSDTYAPTRFFVGFADGGLH